jgi:hypothetical protein
MEHWSTPFLGLPWLAKGRSRAGVDCWGLCYLANLEGRGVRLPTYAETYARPEDSEHLAAVIDAELSDLVHPIEPEAVQTWDFILLREGHWPTHIGLVTSPGKFLHIETDDTSRVQRYLDNEFKRRVVGFYRLTGGACA